MLRVREELCLGCGLCVASCHRGAIALIMGKARIHWQRCSQCGQCLEVCPQGAIVPGVPVSALELKATVASLRQKTDEVMHRLERLRPARRDAHD